MKSTTFKKKILSIDGGGIRGIIPAILLDYIEHKTGKHIAQTFDLISGTSTGGILALGLTKPKENSQPQYAAKDLVSFYRDRGAEIFHERIYGHVDDLIQSKYSSKNRKKVLKEYFDDAQIQTALTGLLITSYDIELRIPVFFVSRPEAAVYDDYYEKICDRYTMLQAAMATSAAPTFFPPYHVQKLRELKRRFSNSKDKIKDELEDLNYALVDGGAFANNPASLALMEAMLQKNVTPDQPKEPIRRDEILLVSLGTGSLTRRYKYEQAKKWGQIKWILPFIDIVFDAQSESVACQLDQLLIHDLEVARSERQETGVEYMPHYFRFQEFLHDANDSMDDASPDNIRDLENLAKKLIEDKKEELEQLCNLL